MEIKAIEEFRQVSAPPAHYYPAPEDRSRKAVFYANLYEPEKRPMYMNAAIGVCVQLARALKLLQVGSCQRRGISRTFSCFEHCCGCVWCLWWSPSGAYYLQLTVHRLPFVHSAA